MVRGCGWPREHREIVCTCVTDVTRRDGPMVHTRHPGHMEGLPTEGWASLARRLLHVKECCIARWAFTSEWVLVLFLYMTIDLPVSTLPAIAKNLSEVILLLHKQDLTCVCVCPCYVVSLNNLDYKRLLRSLFQPCCSAYLFINSSLKNVSVGKQAFIKGNVGGFLCSPTIIGRQLEK